MGNLLGFVNPIDKAVDPFVNRRSDVLSLQIVTISETYQRYARGCSEVVSLNGMPPTSQNR
jgi:hypothetical protein